MFAPVRHANYPGNVVTDVVGQLMGPDLQWLAAAAEYDAARDRTRVEFRAVPGEALADAVLEVSPSPALPCGVIRLAGTLAGSSS